MFHEGGGIYKVRTRDGTIRTKHVTFGEDDYPGDPEIDLETRDSKSSYRADTREECSVVGTSNEE